MTHKMMFAEDYLDFDRDEAEAELQSALPDPADFEPIPVVAQEFIHAVTSEITSCKRLVPARWFRIDSKVYWLEYPMPPLLALYAERLMKQGHIRAERLLFKSGR